MSSTSTSMPAEAKTCLVTGSTGYIGAHVCSALLSAGSTVHAAARTATKAEHLTRVLAQRHPAAFDQKRFQIVLVPDMCVEGAYDEAVKGVHYIFHLAAQCSLFSSTPLTVFNSAVAGTKFLLQSALAHGNTLQRFIHTSSSGALYDFGLKGYELSDDVVYTEEDWNHESVAYTLAQGDEAFPVVAYLAAKTQSELDLWAFMKTHNPSWTAVSLNPPFVYGPLLVPASNPKELNDSLEIIYTFCSQVKPREFLRPRMRFDDWIDVRDCAALHVSAATNPQAAGRFIINAGPLSDNQLARIIKKHFPQYGAGITSTGWNPEESEDFPVTSSTEKMQSVFGEIAWVSLEQSIKESVESIQNLLEQERSQSK